MSPTFAVLILLEFGAGEYACPSLVGLALPPVSGGDTGGWYDAMGGAALPPPPPPFVFFGLVVTGVVGAGAEYGAPPVPCLVCAGGVGEGALLWFGAGV